MSKRELLKENYLKQKDYSDEERKDMEANYEAHHIATLVPELIENQENCILLRKSDAAEELLEHQDYTDWLTNQVGFEKLKTTDIKIVKDILKPIKKAIKKASKTRDLKEVLKNLKGDKL